MSSTSPPAAPSHPNEAHEGEAVAAAAEPKPAATTPASPVAVTSAPPAAPPPPPAARHPNPKVAELQLIFPTVEVSVIELVLESCAGSVDRSIEQLLSMTDENFKPDELAGARREEASQVDLDEEFARSLQLQDEQQQHQQQRSSSRYQSQTRNAQPQYPSQPDAFSGNPDDLPYEARVRRTRPANQNSDGRWTPPVSAERRYQESEATGPPPGAGPGMLMVEEKLERFAEVGKQTFTSLLSRARQKYNEFEQSRAQGQGQGQSQGYGQYADNSNNAQRGDGGNMWGQNGTSAPSGGQGGAGWYNPGGGRQGQGAYPQRGGPGLWGGSQYADTSRSESFSSESTDNAPYNNSAQPAAAGPAARASPARWQPIDTYDEPPQPTRTVSGRTIDIAGGRRSPGVGSPDKGSGKIDAAKLGILPKKRVDLLSTSPSNPQLRSTANAGATGAVVGTAAGGVAGAIAVSAIGTSPKNENQHEHDDPNPGLPGASNHLVNKIPQTPPASERDRYNFDDSDDELEYTRNPFGER